MILNDGLKPAGGITQVAIALRRGSSRDSHGHPPSFDTAKCFGGAGHINSVDVVEKNNGDRNRAPPKHLLAYGARRVVRLMTSA